MVMAYRRVTRTAEPCIFGPALAWLDSSSDQSAWLDGELKLQGLRLALAVDVDIRHLPVGRLAVVRLDILQAHCDRVGRGAPAGYRAGWSQSRSSLPLAHAVGLPQCRQVSRRATGAPPIPT